MNRNTIKVPEHLVDLVWTLDQKYLDEHVKLISNISTSIHDSVVYSNIKMEEKHGIIYVNEREWEIVDKDKFFMTIMTYNG